MYHRSNDGLMLLVTSSDCYCSIITFESNELGDSLAPSVMFQSTKGDSKTELAAKSNEIQPVTNCSDTNHHDSTPALPLADVSSPTRNASNSTGQACSPTGKVNGSLTGQACSPAGKVNHTGQVTSPLGNVSSPTGKPRRIRPTMISAIDSEVAVSPIKQTDSTIQEVKTEIPTQQPVTTSKIVPRRVNLITLSSYKKNHPPPNHDAASEN